MSFRRYVPAIVLVFAMSFFIFDVISDLLSNEDDFIHVFIELLIFIAISYVLFRELQRVESLHKEINKEKMKTARLSGELLQVMKVPFNMWKLTASECDIALLLIKGFSMKKVAEARNVKEKTVRVQATSIYKKSNCSGRHELAAYFIEDLMRDV